ncbi:MULTISPECIES: undecaprenyl-diphosphate phosphatase [Rhizobium/Agrobacterium group]|uniref:Undecaprenyl-diphosphatase n=2 Tax=Rhizobium/Agrobacterium group TaxID=227290 RepID=B9JTE9_ALLAM|nr:MULTISPECIES: undecaprenyl-diphosphate phosphatase [Rhizobium/Agrobacterium group]ACM35862.1 undecaprenol kinase [Allorhizobium ampelinum S4]MCF1460137.1 undecaprenyl-diphosphate phosphatase [Allorhizobium ampelinum]MCF1491979.1 undecaprenyl-diphosphate phosphatase [Allorhizobium ampelinum]MUO30355.1 undecaprenyl-diphosphatase [Agrobacterium vitis]MUO44657.1 undecaprenyl-diphosphatase [Agrobacterium vitis]
MADACVVGSATGFVDLSFVQTAFLGVVQGVTELVPVSSSAHMRVVPALLGWPDPGAAFSAAMQMAALVGVISYFWRDIYGLASGSISAVKRRDFENFDFQLVLWILIATLPIIVAGLALSHTLNSCGSPLRSLWAVGLACLVMGGLLAATELLAKHRRDLPSIRPLDILLVGIAQVGALIPGVSRSGATMTAALALGFKREEAARFSFLLGLPAILLAGLKEVWELHKLALDSHGWALLGVGLVAGGISSLIAIWGLMRFLERFSTWPFVIYRIILGVVLLAAAASGMAS